MFFLVSPGGRIRRRRGEGEREGKRGEGETVLKKVERNGRRGKGPG